MSLPPSLRSVATSMTVRAGHELVLTHGEGTGSSPYFLDGDGAKERAREEADRDAKSRAERIAKMVTCEKCGKRSAVAWFSERVRAATPVVLLMGFVWVVLPMLFDGGRTFTMIVAGGTSALALLIGSMKYLQMARAAEGALFPDAVEALLASADEDDSSV